MHQEIRLHGHLNDTIEFFATAAARDAFGCHFYDVAGDRLRFFSPGNELVLGPDGIRHRGNGGTFCEYMFGVDQPLADLAKGDVRNRLVLYGTTYRESGRLQFTDQTGGFQSYEQIFFRGNALTNYFFFLTGSVSGRLKEQQEGILRLLGKTLKRSNHVGEGEETELLDEIFGLLGHRSSFHLIKLIHKRHKAYQQAFHDLYFANKAIPDPDFETLGNQAERLKVDNYQQERVRIDVMYKNADNRRIVDEYKNILIGCHRRGKIDKLENARLTRLKTLSVRNKIPFALFYTLDEMLQYDHLVELEEQDYLSVTRQILEGIFLHESQIDASINQEDMIKLLFAKRRASENRDATFEQILLETGKACDEKIRDGADISLLEIFSSIVTYFDRFDNTSEQINKLAFMENIPISEEMIRSLLGNKKAFAELAPDLFETLFFSCVHQDKYLGRFGRRKIEKLQKGLIAIEDGRLTVQDLQRQLSAIADEERHYQVLLVHVKDRIRNFYSRYNTRAEQEALRAEVAQELSQKGLPGEDIPPGLFRDVVVHIKKEAVYLHNLLPDIVADRDIALREDFLANSGLDRFYVEELEREYFELNHLDLENLYQIRQGLSA
ncbi:MAG: TIGR04442 family protein [Desulfuromonas sp.]|uniref:TIGR04442 family protein n=1 Tax=Desulfuromonas sp. TaxID=892 RepID=UPI000CB99F50|nr:TIGR04442 family protein [Desulfuromonas sp.]PLX84898.1 MAG: TIGR04442 family protein [Desulfuromonas sp.]